MADKLKHIAKLRNTSINKLMLELSAQIVAEEEAKQHFTAAKLRGNPKRALQLLDELDELGICSFPNSCLGTHTNKLCLARVSVYFKQSLRLGIPKQEFGNEFKENETKRVAFTVGYCRTTNTGL